MTQEIPNILFFPPNRVWRTYLGGKTLDTLEGRPWPKDSHFPEDWIGSTTRAVNPDRPDVSDEGLSSISLQGERVLFRDLVARDPGKMVGEDHYRRYGASTGFLLKLLDSAVRLHIQCHPTVAFAKEHLGSDSGKTEAYVILETRAEVARPYIYLGFQKPPTPRELRRAIEEQDIAALESFFEPIPVQRGDVFMVPGGLPHAIGEGIFMIEIMEPTDFVVRIEYERGGYRLPQEARFMGRDVAFALSMMSLKRISRQQVQKDLFCAPRRLKTYGRDGYEDLLIGTDKTECFGVKKLTVTGQIQKEERSFYLGIVSRGRGEVLDETKKVWPLKQYDRFFVPFSTRELAFRATEPMEIYLFTPPQRR